MPPQPTAAIPTPSRIATAINGPAAPGVLGPPVKPPPGGWSRGRVSWGRRNPGLRVAPGLALASGRPDGSGASRGPGPPVGSKSTQP